MTEPDMVHGAWARRSASVDGCPHFETQLVVWLQAGRQYADLRVPFHPAADERCFTGRSFWDADRYRWTHVLDLEPGSPAADDVGDLRWEDGALVERGLFPTAAGPIAYEEIWARLPGSEGSSCALVAPGACLVRVGDHAITVVDARETGGEFRACYRVREPHGWRVVAAIGNPADLPGPDAPPDWAPLSSSAATARASW